MQIGAKHYHRHGGYLLKHAQLPGFTQLQQRALALLVRGHRRSLPGLAFQAFEPSFGELILRLLAVLRLAVILHRSHNDADTPVVKLRVQEDGLVLAVGEAWLQSHPLSKAELAVESRQLAQAGIALRVC